MHLAQLICRYETREVSNYTARYFRESLIKEHLRQRTSKITNPILGKSNQVSL
jgi:hypothetical protein